MIRNLLVRESLRRVLLGLFLMGMCLSFLAALPRTLLRNELENSLRKWVAQDRQGQFYLLSPRGDASGFYLRVSDRFPVLSLEDFDEPQFLVSPVGQEPILSAGLILDDDDEVHFVWSTRSGLTAYSLLRFSDLPGTSAPSWHHPETGKEGALVLAPQLSRIGDIVLGPNGRTWVVWTVASNSHDVTIFLGIIGPDGLISKKIASGLGLFPPTLFIDTHGSFHLVWHDVYEESYYLYGSLAQLVEGNPERVQTLSKNGYRAVVSEASGRAFAVYEDNYNQINSQFLQEEDGEKISLTGSLPRFRYHTLHSPQLSLDRYGIPWLFFVDSSRKHAFQTRWLGEKWGPIHRIAKMTRNSPRMEDNHLSIDGLAVQNQSLEGASTIGILLVHGDEQVFQLVPVPSLVASPGRKVLFLDLQEIQEVEGLDLHLNQAKKYSGNPVIQAGKKDEPDFHGAGNFLRVLKEKGVFRMWYSAFRRVPERSWWDWYQVGYAESQDGYHFKKKQLIPYLPYVPAVLRDDYESDPAQRYKLLQFPTHGSRAGLARAGKYDPWKEANPGALWVSPDGIDWTQRPTRMLFPAGRPFSLMSQSLLYDREEKDSSKRYKMYGFSSLNSDRRGGSYAYSSDGINWTAHPNNPILDPFARTIPVVRGGKVHQIHDLVVWKDGDYYMALYQYQYNGHKLDLELATSRDGENFMFVKPGQKVIPMGSARSWDCDHIVPSLPLVDGDEIKIYYGSICGEGTAQERRSGGVAILRKDGFTHLQLEKGSVEGRLTTIPIQPGEASQLWVNVDCGADGYLEVELLDIEHGVPIAGYTRRESIPIKGDSIAKKITWTRGGDLSSLRTQFQVCFYLVGSGSFPKIYSFEFR